MAKRSSGLACHETRAIGQHLDSNYLHSREAKYAPIGQTIAQAPLLDSDGNLWHHPIKTHSLHRWQMRTQT